MLTIGIDEAGYGTIAGPLIIAAVAYDSDADPPYIEEWKRIYVQDSKALRDDYIKRLATRIHETALMCEVLTLTAPEIDRSGGPHDCKVNGIALVAKRLVERLHITDLEIERTARIVVDGLITLDVTFPYEGLPKADKDIWQVSAASVLAKAAQIEAMDLLHEQYRNYAFKQNRGYPTQGHIERLKKYGPCKHHRRSTRALAAWRKKPKGRE